MTKDKMRHVATGSARSYLRNMGFSDEEMTYDAALKALDDLARSQAGLISSQWYNTSSNNQIKLFKKEWNTWLKRQIA